MRSGLVELLEALYHLLGHERLAEADVVPADARVPYSQTVLHREEALHQDAAIIEHLMREHVLLTVHPEKGEA